LKRVRDALLEVAGPVLPVALLVVLVQLVVVDVSGRLFARFLIGVVLVIVGLFLFLTGVTLGLLPVGRYIGSHLHERVGPWLLGVVVFFIGFGATVAEPDVRVLSGVVESILGGWLDALFLIVLIAVGLGLALAAAVLRPLLGVRLAVMLGVGYAFVLAVFPFVSPSYVALALDSGATTTGPLTVPLVMAIGLGASRAIAGSGSLGDGFGLVGMASLGPVVLLVIVGLFA